MSDDQGLGPAIRHRNQVRAALVGYFQRLRRELTEKSPCFMSNFYRGTEIIRHNSLLPSNWDFVRLARRPDGAFHFMGTSLKKLQVITLNGNV
jgi:hypothetical protein